MKNILLFCCMVIFYTISLLSKQKQMKTLKEVAHLYLGCEMRMFNTVTEQWSSWRNMSCSDLNLILRYDARVELVLKDLSEITNEDAQEVGYDNSYSFRADGRNYATGIPLMSVESYEYLIRNWYDVFGLLNSGVAVPF